MAMTELTETSDHENKGLRSCRRLLSYKTLSTVIDGRPVAILIDFYILWAFGPHISDKESKISNAVSVCSSRSWFPFRSKKSLSQKGCFVMPPNSPLELQS